MMTQRPNRITAKSNLQATKPVNQDQPCCNIVNFSKEAIEKWKEPQLQTHTHPGNVLSIPQQTGMDCVTV